MFVFLLVIGVTAITLQLTVHKVWERTLREQIERNLKQKTLMFAYRVEADRQHHLADIAAQEGQAAGARAMEDVAAIAREIVRGAASIQPSVPPL